MNSIRSIESYSSFRDFLRDVFDADRKSRGAGLTHIALKLDISPALLSLILNGKRSLSLPLLHKIATYLRMTSMERDYFESSVLLEQSSTEDERRHFKRRLKSFPKKSGNNTSRKIASSLIEHARISVVMVYLLDVISESDRITWLQNGNSELPKSDLKAMAKLTDLPFEEIRFLLNSIRKEGVLSTCDNGSTHVRFDALTSQRHQVRHVTAMLNSLAGRMEAIYADERSLARTFAFSIPQKDLPVFIQNVRDLFHQTIDTSSIAKKKKRSCVVVEAAVVINPLHNFE